GEPRALVADRLHKLLGLGQGQAANAVHLLGNDNLAGLQVRDHAQQLGPVGARAGCLLTIDGGHVVAGRLRALDDGFLPAHVLLVGADADIDPCDLGRCHFGASYRMLGIPVPRNMAFCWAAIAFLQLGVSASSPGLFRHSAICALRSSGWSRKYDTSCTARASVASSLLAGLQAVSTAKAPSVITSRLVSPLAHFGIP